MSETTKLIVRPEKDRVGQSVFSNGEFTIRRAYDTTSKQPVYICVFAPKTQQRSVLKRMFANAGYPLWQKYPVLFSIVVGILICSLVDELLLDSDAAHVAMLCIRLLVFILYLAIIVIFSAWAYSTNPLVVEKIRNIHSSYTFQLYVSLTFSIAAINASIAVMDSTSFTKIDTLTQRPVYMMLAMLYFSLVTSATVGYGDIAPMTWPAYITTSIHVVIVSVFAVLLISNITTTSQVPVVTLEGSDYSGRNMIEFVEVKTGRAPAGFAQSNVTNK